MVSTNAAADARECSFVGMFATNLATGMVLAHLATKSAETSVAILLALIHVASR